MLIDSAAEIAVLPLGTVGGRQSSCVFISRLLGTILRVTLKKRGLA